MTSWTASHQAPLSTGCSRQEYWSGLPCPSPILNHSRYQRARCFLAGKAKRDLVTGLKVPQFSLVAQSCPTLCNPMDCSRPGFPVHHQLLELAQLMSINLLMPSNHLILCRPLLLPPSIFPSIRVFSDKSALHIRWPKYWSFSFNISTSNEHPGLISTGWISLQSKGLSRVFSNTTVQKHQFFSVQLSL